MATNTSTYSDIHRIILQGIMCRSMIDANEACNLMDVATLRCEGKSILFSQYSFHVIRF